MNSPEIITIRTMLGHGNVGLALKCLSSIKKMTGHAIEFTIHEDGSLCDEDRNQLSAILGRCKFINKFEATQAVNDWLANFPLCKQFRNQHLFGLKLFDIAYYSYSRVIYCDTDILFTHPLVCPDYFLGNSFPFICMQDLKESYAISISKWSLLKKHGIQLSSKVCAGMISYDRAALDLEYVEWLLKIDQQTGLFSGFNFWAEQTIYAALAARATCRWIDPKFCLVAHQANFKRAKNASIIHFAGFSRPLFSSFYDNLVYRQDDTPRILSTTRAPLCSTFKRLTSAAQTRLFYSGNTPKSSL